MIVQDEPLEIDLHAVRPMRDWLVIERIWEEESAVGCLVIPEIAQIKPHLGKVVSVGPGRRFPDGSRKPMQVKVGDVVRWQSADIDTRDLVLIQEQDVLGVVNDR